MKKIYQFFVWLEFHVKFKIFKFNVFLTADTMINIFSADKPLGNKFFSIFLLIESEKFKTADK